MTWLSQACIGTPGATVSNSNAATGNQFDAESSTGAGTTATWDATHTLHGNATALRLHYPAGVAATAFVQWKASITATANSLLRSYLYLPAAPSVTIRLASMATGNGSPSSALLLLPNGTVRLANSAGGNVATTTTALPFGQPVRVEYEATGISGTTGNLALRFYSGPNLEGSTPDSGGSLSGTGVGVAGLVNDVRLGTSSATTETSALDVWYSDIGWSDTAQAGSVVKVFDAAQTLALTQTTDLRRVASFDAEQMLDPTAAADLRRVVTLDAEQELALVQHAGFAVLRTDFTAASVAAKTVLAPNPAAASIGENTSTANLAPNLSGASL